MQLTKTLLQIDFGLMLELPDNRLCFPVRLRLERLYDFFDLSLDNITVALLGLSLPFLLTRASKVPNRHNYILWLKELLDSSSYAGPGRKLSGLDIGTGAGCIYPLLGAAQRPWRFIATGR